MLFIRFIFPRVFIELKTNKKALGDPALPGLPFKDHTVTVSSDRNTNHLNILHFSVQCSGYIHVVNESFFHT